ncbi:hypothetical protein [Nannocystis radixulma]|uniref:Uncharacterized protein n=1 Tax=Nannocystis radixulma TaxID=2995305 RepID=A0ABT5B6W7_9BACT|nr:hypothetical protein [Nannocystis radixulma]MDC0668827.1 hypothetical protein [Nannocystis radixulma]
MHHHIVGSILTLTLAAPPDAYDLAAPSTTECTFEFEEDRWVESVVLPGGGEIETIEAESSMTINFYLDGRKVLSVAERDGDIDSRTTEYGLALAPERAAEFHSELKAAMPSLMSTDRCPGVSRSKVDEKFKCDLLAVGAGILGALACGGLCGGGIGGSVKAVCNWIVDKACEKNSEGC